MFFQPCSVKKPKKGYNLLHLEGPECHVAMLRARILLDNCNEE